MLLRRVIEHVRNQQWTAVFIDFLIVVLGVVIGLQVNNWNEARRDRVQERVYLAGIAAELDESIVSIKRSIELTNERIALDELLIKAAADPAVVRADPGRFIYAVSHGGHSFDPTIQDHTFEAVKSAGKLDIFRDGKLVLDLMKFYAFVQGTEQWEIFTSSTQVEYTTRSAGILSAQDMMLSAKDSRVVQTVDVETAMAAYQRMQERPEFIEWVPTVLFIRADDLRDSNRKLQAATELRARIPVQPSGDTQGNTGT